MDFLEEAQQNSTQFQPSSPKQTSNSCKSIYNDCIIDINYVYSSL